MDRKILKAIKLAIYIIIAIFFSLFIIRAFSHKEIDDVSPLIPCNSYYLNKADILWVIPKFKGIPISQNKTWCEHILRLNKTLGLHGVTHEYNEFGADKNDSYLQEGIEIFEKCFNKKPLMFKPPQLNISKNNIKLIKRDNLSLKLNLNQLTHKVYHCSDTGIFPNKFIDIF